MEAWILRGIVRAPCFALAPSMVLEACHSYMCGMYVDQSKHVKVCFLIE